MTTRPYELLARFDNQGNVAGVSIKSISTINGKDYELDPVPLAGTTDPAFTAFAASFSAGVVAERDALATDKATLTTDLAAKTTEHDSVKGQYDALVVEKAKLISDNTKAIDELETAQDKALVLVVKKNDELKAELTTLQNQVAFLQGIRTYDPNVIKSEAFYQRITGDERFALGVLALTDDNAKGILSLLNAYLKNEWQVLLDDPQVVGAMQYLASTGLLSEERVKEITRPASRE